MGRSMRYLVASVLLLLALVTAGDRAAGYGVRLNADYQATSPPQFPDYLTS